MKGGANPNNNHSDNFLGYPWNWSELNCASESSRHGHEIRKITWSYNDDVISIVQIWSNLTCLWSMFLLYTPWKHQKAFGFLVSPGDIKQENWLEMGSWMFVTYQYVKSVFIWSFSGPYFPAFGLNVERYFVSLRIQTECGKIRTRKTPNTDTFHSVYPIAKTWRTWSFLQGSYSFLPKLCDLTMATTSLAFSLV